MPGRVREPKREQVEHPRKARKPQKFIHIHFDSFAPNEERCVYTVLTAQPPDEEAHSVERMAQPACTPEEGKLPTP